MVTVNIANLDDEQGLPLSAPTGAWVTIDQSPAVLGVAAALGNWLDSLSPVNAATPVSVLEYISAATQPIANLRAELAAFGFPSGEYIGEVFERRVAARKLQYFQQRNTAALLVELASEAEFTYTLSWLPETGQRTTMNICITPSTLIRTEQGWAEFIRRWLEWSYPYFANGGTVVTLCPIIRAAVDYALTVLPVYQGVVSYG